MRRHGRPERSTWSPERRPPPWSVAGVAAGVAAASAAGASESPPCPMADASLADRLSRCSGISVTAQDDRWRDRASSSKSLASSMISLPITSGALAHNLRALAECRARLRTSAPRATVQVLIVIRFPMRHEPMRERTPRVVDASPSTCCNWPGVNAGVHRFVHRRGSRCVRDHPVRQATPGRHARSWGEAMLAGHLHLRCAVPRVRHRAPPVDRPRRQEPRVGSQRQVIYGPGGILKPKSLGGWNPFTLQYEAVRDIVVVAASTSSSSALHDLAMGLVAEARRRASRRNCATSTLRPPLVKKA